MNCSYAEIIDAMGEPKWWNEYAAPRYVEFSPRHVANIYADYCALVLIACQACGHEYQVAFSGAEFNDRDLASLIRSGAIHYGDPPNFCCHGGATMNCEDLRVLEYWTRKTNVFREWKRLPNLEIVLPDGRDDQLEGKR
jgi:hypothetical protein